MSKVIPIRLSNSALNTFNKCEREFEQDRLLVGGIKDENADTVFGKAYGIGIATYFVTRDREKALYHAWLSYWPALETEKKNQWRMLAALNASFFIVDNLLLEWEVAFFNEKPAVELSFRLNISDDYYFVGYIDIVLRHIFTGKYAVLDAKTTGSLIDDLAPMYKNSGQLVGYSIALDRIVGAELVSFDVIYLVAQLLKDWRAKVQVLTFNKTITDRLHWFLTLGMDKERLDMSAKFGFYPRRGDSCLKYNRPCKYFGVCHLHTQDTPKERVEDTIEYDFVYELDELVADHLKRVQNLWPIEELVTSSILDLDS